MAEEKRLYPVIYKVDGKDAFFKVKDNLGLNPAPGEDPWKSRKVAFEIFRYAPKPNIAVRHSLDIDALLWLKMLVCDRIMRDGDVFTDYKGSKDYKNESPTGYVARVLRIERQPAKTADRTNELHPGGQLDDSGPMYIVRISNGPGELTDGGQGAVKPAQGHEQLSAVFPLRGHQFAKALMITEQYINSWTAFRFEDVRYAHGLWNERGSDEAQAAAPSAASHDTPDVTDPERYL